MLDRPPGGQSPQPERVETTYTNLLGWDVSIERQPAVAQAVQSGSWPDAFGRPTPAVSTLYTRASMPKQLIELISRGVLVPGTEVFHTGRGHIEPPVSARIVDGGIDIDGTVYASPSGAARSITGTTAENGWVWWRVRDSGKTLSEIRSET